MIKFILVFFLLIFAIYAIQQRRKFFIVSILISCVSLFGVFLVLFPEVSNVVANFLGVGRGADLLLYFCIVGGGIVVFNLHLKNRSLMDKHTNVVRNMAILEKEIEDKLSDLGTDK